MRHTKFFENGTIVEFINEWEQFFTKDKFNWIEFHPLLLRVEKNVMFGEFEFELYLLGFGVRVAWIYNPKAYTAKINTYTTKFQLFEKTNTEVKKCKKSKK